jgi:glycosyltransferase involved in cell wall biosynthesis
VTTVSSWLAGQVKTMVPASDPIVSPMPVATHLFTPGGPRHARRLLFVGRLNAQKGIALLLDALAVMRQPAELDVIGDGSERAALLEQAQALGIAARVRWLERCRNHACSTSIAPPRLLWCLRARKASGWWR